MVARLQRLMAIMASKPRALPWAVLWRPFRPCIRTAMLEEESHGFSLDGTAQGLRYGRLGSLRYKGLPWFCRFHYEMSGLIVSIPTVERLYGQPDPEPSGAAHNSTLSALNWVVAAYPAYPLCGNAGLNDFHPVGMEPG